MAHHTHTHGHGHRVKKEPIKLDPSREKLIMRPDAPLPKFFPAPKAIQVTPIYDDDDDGAAAAFYPPHSSSYPNNNSRSRPTSRLSSRPNSRPSSVYPRRSRSHTPGRRAVYTDSEYDYDDAGYGSESSWGGEPGRSRSASGSAYGYGGRGRRSYSSDSGRGQTRSRTRTGYASGTEHDYSGYDYSRSRPGTMYSAYDRGYGSTPAYGYSPGSAYDDDGQTYQARSRPANALTPSGKPYSQAPQPHSIPLAASASGHSHGHGHNYSHSQGQGQTMMPQSASASAYALSLAQSQSGNNGHRRSRLPDAVTPSGKPYSQTPQPHPAPSAAAMGYTPSKSNSLLQPVVQVPGSVRSSHSHGGAGRGGFGGGGAFGGYQPTLPPPSAHSMHSHHSHGGGGGHVPSHTRSHHHRSSSSLSSTGRSSGGSTSSSTSVHRFTIQSPSSVAHTHVSYVPSRTPSHAVPDFSTGAGGGRGGGVTKPGSQYSYAGGGGASRPVSTYSYAGGAGGRPTSQAPSRMSYAPSRAPGSIMSASSAPSVGGGNTRDKGFFDAIERYLKVLPTNPNFCWSNCSGRKKAVCIGINYVGQRDELNGCANDARNIRKFLISTYGFKSEDILLLLDDKDSRYAKGTLKPTKREMFNAMAWLVKGAKMHDSLFFHYSGHGGQSTDASGKEADGKDETIYPVDYNKDGDIIDDELYQALVEPLPAGCRLTAIFDSCHSGTVLDLPYLHSAHGRLRGMNHISKRAQKRGVAPGADVICFAACKDDETSADTFHGGVATGAMSYALVQTLQQNPHMTYEELLMHLRDTLIPKYHQKAQISGTHPVDLSRPFTL